MDNREQEVLIKKIKDTSDKEKKEFVKRQLENVKLKDVVKDNSKRRNHTADEVVSERSRTIPGNNKERLNIEKENASRDKADKYKTPEWAKGKGYFMGKEVKLDSGLELSNNKNKKRFSADEIVSIKANTSKEVDTKTREREAKPTKDVVDNNILKGKEKE